MLRDSGLQRFSLGLGEKQADGDLVRKMLAFAAERIMELEIKARAAKGARSPLREAQRNGCRDRDTRAGRVALEIPKLRKGDQFPSFLEARRAAGETLVAVVQKACVQGISTRSFIRLPRVSSTEPHAYCAWT